jgi:putative transposase
VLVCLEGVSDCRTPETVVRWHRAGFRLYWTLISKVRSRVGRKRVPKEVRDLIFRMVAENRTGGAPRIHGELLMLGFDVSERSISGWMKRAPRDPEAARRWLAFLRNDRRRVLHFNVTCHPTSAWIVQQLREAFPYQSAAKFLIFDHDAKYWLEVPAAIRSMSIACLQTTIQSPWQNGVAERWVGSCRRDLLDHIIALNERHLRRLLSEYDSYYHDDRTHLGVV